MKVGLPFLLSLFLLLLFFHDGCVGLLSVGLTRCVCHVDAEDVDGVMIGRRGDEARVPAELQVIYFSFVCATAEHERAGRVLRVNFPDADQSALLTGRREQVAVSIQGHGCNRALMAHNHGLSAVRLRKRPHFHVAFLGMRDG